MSMYLRAIWKRKLSSTFMPEVKALKPIGKRLLKVQKHFFRFLESLALPILASKDPESLPGLCDPLWLWKILRAIAHVSEDAIQLDLCTIS